MAIRGIKRAWYIFTSKCWDVKLMSTLKSEKGGTGWMTQNVMPQIFRTTSPPTPSANYAQLIFPWDLSIVRIMFILVHSHWALGVCDPMSHLCNQQWLQQQLYAHVLSTRTDEVLKSRIRGPRCQSLDNVNGVNATINSQLICLQ